MPYEDYFSAERETHSYSVNQTTYRRFVASLRYENERNERKARRMTRNGKPTKMARGQEGTEEEGTSKVLF